MTTHRRESAGLKAYIATSRGVIRVFAAVLALLGLILITNEILEQILGCEAAVCQPIHIAPMAWGIGLLMLGCLILQRGDVSVSIGEALTFGQRLVRLRAEFFGRRAYDKAAAPVAAEGPSGLVPAPDPAVDADKVESIERPKFTPGGIS